MVLEVMVLESSRVEVEWVGVGFGGLVLECGEMELWRRASKGYEMCSMKCLRDMVIGLL